MWTISVSYDGDNDAVANVSVICTEENGDTFQYQIRRPSVIEDLSACASRKEYSQFPEVIKARDEWQRKRALNTEAATMLLKMLNAEDPQTKGV